LTRRTLTVDNRRMESLLVAVVALAIVMLVQWLELRDL
jgi:hypothetical protein